jgi:hypothetical protein
MLPTHARRLPTAASARCFERSNAGSGRAPSAPYRRSSWILDSVAPSDHVGAAGRTGSDCRIAAGLNDGADRDELRRPWLGGGDRAARPDSKNPSSMPVPGLRQQFIERSDDVALNIVVQDRRDAKTAKYFFRRRPKGLQYVPRIIMKLRRYVLRKAICFLTSSTGQAAISTIVPRRRHRQRQRFKSPGQAQGYHRDNAVPAIFPHHRFVGHRSPSHDRTERISRRRLAPIGTVSARIFSKALISENIP